MSITNLTDQLKRDEGLRLTAYKDSVGILTIGYGHNLQAHEQHITSCTLEQAEQWLTEDMATAQHELAAHLPWATTLDSVRQAALINMWFNMGAKLLGFHNTLTYMQCGKYENAATEMLHSLWAHQVGSRANRLAKQIESGRWQ